MGDAADDIADLSGLAEAHYERQERRMAQVRKEVPSGPKKKVKKKTRQTPDSEKSGREILLPDTFNDPPVVLEDSVIMMHGEKAVGKTSLFSQFPDSYTFMFERLRKNLKIRQVSPEDWEQFKEYAEAFIKSKYRFAIIDTLDACYLMCYAWVCKQHNVTNPEASSSPYIIWDAIAEEFGGLLVLIKESGKGLGFISHTKARPMTQKRAGLARDELEEVETLNRLEPTCKPAAFRLVQEIADFVFYYGWKDGKRAITVRDPYNVHWVACGIEERFCDPKGKPINSFYVGSPASQAFKDLVDAYHNKKHDTDWSPSLEHASTPRKGTKKKKKRRV